MKTGASGRNPMESSAGERIRTRFSKTQRNLAQTGAIQHNPAQTGTRKAATTKTDTSKQILRFST